MHEYKENVLYPVESRTGGSISLLMAVTAWYINITVDTISIIPFRITKPLGISFDMDYIFDYYKTFFGGRYFLYFLDTTY